MKREIITNLLVLAGALLYFLLFWWDSMGLNTLIFTTFYIAVLYWCYPESPYSATRIATSAGTFFCALMVVWHHSLLSQFAFLCSFGLMVGSFQARSIRFLWYSGLMSMVSLFEVPFKLMREFRPLGIFGRQGKSIFRQASLFFLPLIILLVFFTIYYNANPLFAQMIDRLTPDIRVWWSWQIDTEKLAFFILGLFITGAGFWKSNWDVFSARESGITESLHRRKGGIIFTYFPIRFSNLSLKREYQTSKILLVALNVLLLLVNLSDISYVWLKLEDPTPQMLSNYVHEGTSLLIIAILLGMVVLLFIFRKNLNFFPGNGALKRLAYLWIGQNVVLSYAVLMRNIHYINHYGLAYKRIGVMAFVLLVLVGLLTLLIKIKDRKTIYFLLHKNTWAIFFILILSTSVDWDVFITRYNIRANTVEKIDTDFLTQLNSDKNLFLLHQNQELLKQQGILSEQIFNERLKESIIRFRERTSAQGWLSWNYADYRNHRYLVRIKH